MKKSFKRRLTALLLALAMVMTAFAGFGGAALAGATGTATIDIYVDGDYYFSVDADVTDGTTVYDAIEQNASELEPVWTLVPDVDEPTILWHAIVSLMGAGSDPIGEDSGVSAEAWSTVNPGYGLVSVDYDEDDNPVLYNYVYAGYDWVYAVNGVQPETQYTDQYELSEGDVVTLSYDLQVEYWSSASPWMPTYPYI
jgi:hypothetical protein